MTESNIRTSSDIAAAIMEKRARFNELNQQRQAVAAELAQHQASNGRIIAEGGAVPQNVKLHVRELNDQESDANAGMRAIESQLPELEAELKNAKMREAKQDVIAADERAIAAAETFDALVLKLVGSKLFPAVETLLKVFDETRDARYRAQQLEYGTAARNNHDDPLPADVAKRVGPALRLIAPVKGFMSDLKQLTAEDLAVSQLANVATTEVGPTVLVSMPRSYGYQGKHYGPGSAVRVPVGLQEAADLQIIEESATAEESEGVAA